MSSGSTGSASSAGTKASSHKAKPAPKQRTKKAKPKKETKKKKRAGAVPFTSGPEPPAPGAPATGASPAFASSQGGARPSLEFLLLSMMGLGSAVLLALALTPLRSLAGVSVRLAQRRSEVGMVTACVLGASIIGFLAVVLGA